MSEDEYNSFFKTTFKEFLDPAAHSHFNVEGTIEFSALLYVPGMAPFEEQVSATSFPEIITFAFTTSLPIGIARI